MATFSIQSPTYEGPLDALLDLIERRKLLINDIALAAVTDEYMEYLKHFEEHPVGETAEFILIASTLILIKSKSLLPILDLTSEEEQNMEDLESRLRHLAIFREASRVLAEQFGERMLYDREYVANDEPLFATDRYTNIDSLYEAMRSAISNLPKRALMPQTVVKKVVSLEDTIKKLEERILRQFKMSFSEFTRGASELDAVILGFLAVLELVKQGCIAVRQEDRFSEIHIEREAIDTPKYL